MGWPFTPHSVLWCRRYLHFLFFFWPHGMWDLSSLSRDGTRAPYKRTVETQPLNHQGSSRLYIFIMSNLSAFSSVACSFAVISKKSSPNPMSWSFSPKFYPKSFVVFTLILSLLWVNFYIWCTVRIQLLFFFCFACKVCSFIILIWQKDWGTDGSSKIRQSQTASKWRSQDSNWSTLSSSRNWSFIFSDFNSSGFIFVFVAYDLSNLWY